MSLTNFCCMVESYCSHPETELRAALNSAQLVSTPGFLLLACWQWFCVPGSSYPFFFVSESLGERVSTEAKDFPISSLEPSLKKEVKDTNGIVGLRKHLQPVSMF